MYKIQSTMYNVQCEIFKERNLSVFIKKRAKIRFFSRFTAVHMKIKSRKPDNLACGMNMLCSMNR